MTTILTPGAVAPCASPDAAPAGGTSAAAASPPGSRGARPPAPLVRQSLPDAVSRRLFFAQVREDPTLEIEAIPRDRRGHVVVVGSGGCTALSLLAGGAGRVTAIDLNTTQNHLIELKMAAVSALAADDAVAFLGGRPATREARLRTWAALRPLLTPQARRWWDGHRRALARGALHAGASERFLGLVAQAVRWFVHGDARIARLLACRSLAEQRAFYDREWNTRRWRALFALLLNRAVFSRAYDPAFFRDATVTSFAAHFRETVRRGLTDVPVAGNYFLHDLLTGAFAPDPEARPPYLTKAGAAALAGHRDRLALVDGSVTAYLRGTPSCTVTAFSLSNIAEWLSSAELDAMLAEVVRTAAPGAVLCFRNFVGHTAIPVIWRDRIVEDAARGAAMLRRDRSLAQSRFAVCTIHKECA